MNKEELAAETATTHQRAAWTLDSIGDAVLSTDAAGNVAYLNAVAEQMTGWSRRAAMGRPLAEVFRIIDRDTRAPAIDPTCEALRRNATVTLTPNCLLVSRSGAEEAIEDSTAPIRGDDGQVLGAVIVFRKVGEALEASRQLLHLAHHDPLTGLPNRTLMLERLNAALSLSVRHATPLVVMFIDLDGFKGINDSRGHAVGDQLLRSIALRLSSSLRLSDTACRLGGDEFVVVLTEIADRGDAAVVAARMLRALAVPHPIQGHNCEVTASIGLAIHPDHGSDAATLLGHADEAMFAAKQAGRNTYSFSPSVRSDVDTATELAATSVAASA